MSFHKNVFVNCPFDDDYRPLLRPLLFTIAYLGLKPRIALEELDSGSPRIQKIIGPIRISRYAIHDLSRLHARKKGEYYRLNMPLELGIDVGCRLFGRGQNRLKRCLVLEEQRYRYQAAISDLSGSDIGAHGRSPEALVTEVRNWLNSQAHVQAPGPARVWTAFLEFMSDNYDALKERGFSDLDIENLQVGELMNCIDKWVSATRTRFLATNQLGTAICRTVNLTHCGRTAEVDIQTPLKSSGRLGFGRPRPATGRLPRLFSWTACYGRNPVVGRMGCYRHESARTRSWLIVSRSADTGKPRIGLDRTSGMA